MLNGLKSSLFWGIVTKTYYILFILYILSVPYTAFSKIINSNSDVFINIIPFILNDTHAKFINDYSTIILGCMFLFYIARQLVIKIQRRKRNSKIIGLLSEYVINYGIFRSNLAGNIAAKTDSTILVQYSIEYLRTTCDEIQKIFTIITGDYCHVSIKVFDQDSGEISTYVRDKMAYVNRNMEDDHQSIYPYKGNTAFKHILDNKKHGYFVSNWLSIRSMFGKYENSHEGWKSLYRATIVKPLTFKLHNSDINHDSVVGFLCIDNKNGNFNRKMCVEVMHCFSRVMCEVFDINGKIIPETKP